MTPLKQLSSISTPDASTILISPFDKTSIKAIEKAINESDVSGAQACLSAV
jgi:ribosome recycling factor